MIQFTARWIFLENGTRAKRRFWKIKPQTKYQVMNGSLIHNLNERQYGLESNTFALNYRMYQFVPLCYWTSKVWKIYLDKSNVSDWQEYVKKRIWFRPTSSTTGSTNWSSSPFRSRNHCVYHIHIENHFLSFRELVGNNNNNNCNFSA